MLNNEEYEKILNDTQELGRTQFVKLIYEKQKRIMELEEINEEHRKLNAKLNQEIKELKNTKVTEEELDKLNREFYGFTIKQIDDDLGRYAIRFSDLEREKQHLISYLEEKIDTQNQLLQDWMVDTYTYNYQKGMLFAYKEILDFIKGEGKK